MDFVYLGNKSPLKALLIIAPLIFYLIHLAASKGFLIPKFSALISNKSLTSLEIFKGLNHLQLKIKSTTFSSV